MNRGERKTFRADVKSVETTDDTTQLLVKVTSFGSPEVKDLGGDYFMRDCDFGDTRVQTVKAFYDHALNTENNPYAKAVEQLIGTATLKTVDDEGRWFLFEIEKSNAYHDAILALHERKILGASTQAYMGGVDRQEDGGIKRWWESEVTLTVTPMDQKTIGETMLILEEEATDEDTSLKTLLDHWKALLEREEADRKTAEEAEEEEQSEDDNSDDIPADGAGEEEQRFDDLDLDFDAEIDELLADNLDAEFAQKFVTREDFDEVLGELRKLSGMVSAYVDVWGSLDEGQDVAALLSGIVSGQEELAKSVSVTQKAVRTLGKHVSEVVTSEVQKTLKVRSAMSDLEKDAEQLLEQGDGRKTLPRGSKAFPDNAPGG